MTRQRKYQRRKREWLIVTKLLSGCDMCGFTPSRRNARKLHYHHRDPSDKLFNISNECHNVSWAMLRAEVAKCDVLCADCHATTETFGNGQSK